MTEVFVWSSKQQQKQEDDDRKKEETTHAGSVCHSQFVCSGVSGQPNSFYPKFNLQMLIAEIMKNCLCFIKLRI